MKRRLYVDTSAYLCILLGDPGSQRLSDETTNAEAGAVDKISDVGYRAGAGGSGVGPAGVSRLELPGAPSRHFTAFRSADCQLSRTLSGAPTPELVGTGTLTTKVPSGSTSYGTYPLVAVSKSGTAVPT